ncbi:hypothetical protein ACHAW5_002486 [Stephanodiscus triporus]|uniref:Kinesin motor domain-containing protein n=1 Tax=Stephanodiscus triporus TaxID=2934178 RepID=A0ABD3QK25_9STRA
MGIEETAGIQVYLRIRPAANQLTQRDVFRGVDPSHSGILAWLQLYSICVHKLGVVKHSQLREAERYEDRDPSRERSTHLFRRLRKDDEQKGIAFSCFISYLEIYNQSGYDLLMQGNNGNAAFEEVPKVTMMEDEDGAFTSRVFQC